MKEILKPVPVETGEKGGQVVKPLTPNADIQKYLDKVRDACGAKLSTEENKDHKIKGSTFN